MNSLFDWMLVAPRVVDPLQSLIAKVFGNGEQGALYVPKPVINGQQALFQDYQMTIPATAPGDPVGAMLDVSGNGNHATQPVSASRPIYQQLIGPTGMRHWLDFSGGPKYLLASPVMVSLAVADNLAVSAAIRSPSTTDQRVVTEAQTSSDGMIFCPVQEGIAYYDTITRHSVFIRSSSGEVKASQSLPTPVAFDNNPHVVNTAITGGQLALSVDGGVAAQQSIDMSNFGQSHVMTIGGMLRTSFGAEFTGELFGLVISKNGVSEQAENYLASLAGVTLP